MYLINRDFPLKPGPKCLKVDDMRILTAQKQPSAPDVLKVVKNGASSVVFVVQKQMESLVSSILTQNGYLLSPDHLRIFIAGREETKKNKNTPIFWIQKSGKIDGFFSIFPVNDVANYTLLGRIKLAQRAHYDTENGELTALFGPTLLSPVLNLRAEFFRSRVFEGLCKSDQKVVGGCLEMLEGLEYGKKDLKHEDLVVPAVSKVIHTVYLSRK